MAAFDLPSGIPVTFPTDENSVPYITVFDSGNYHAVPSAQYIKNASNLWVPISANDPMPIQTISQYPIGATLFVSTDTSSANTAKTVTISAVASKKHYCLGYLVVIRGAASSLDIIVTLKDDTTVKLTDVIGNGSPSGTGITNPYGYLLECTTNKNLTLNVGAGGAGVYTELTVWGYTL